MPRRGLVLPLRPAWTVSQDKKPLVSRYRAVAAVLVDKFHRRHVSNPPYFPEHGDGNGRENGKICAFFW